MYSIFAVTNKHTAKLHHVGSLRILTYDARKIKHKITSQCLLFQTVHYQILLLDVSNAVTYSYRNITQTLPQTGHLTYESTNYR